MTCPADESRHCPSPSCRPTTSPTSASPPRARAHRVGRARDAGAAPDPRALRSESARSRGCASGLPARHDRDREPGADAPGRRRRRRACALTTRSPPGRRRGRARGGIRHPHLRAATARTATTYYAHIDAIADTHPQITMDDGCDLVTHLHTKRPAQLAGVIGGTEETTTGVIRLRAMDADGALRLPGHRRQRRPDQAPLRQPLRHRPVARSTASSAPPTSCWPDGTWWSPATAGAARASPSRVPRAWARRSRSPRSTRSRRSRPPMDGFQVMPMAQAAPWGDVFVTATGDVNVIRARALSRDARRRDPGQLRPLQRGDRPPALGALAEGHAAKCGSSSTSTTSDGRRATLLGEGRLINLAAAEGHPATVMDMSFANQALCLEYLVAAPRRARAERLRRARRDRPEVARLKLAAMGMGSIR